SHGTTPIRFLNSIQQLAAVYMRPRARARLPNGCGTKPKDSGHFDAHRKNAYNTQTAAAPGEFSRRISVRYRRHQPCHMRPTMTPKTYTSRSASGVSLGSASSVTSILTSTSLYSG